MHVPFVSDWLMRRRRAQQKADDDSADAVKSFAKGLEGYYLRSERDQIFGQNIAHRMDNVIDKYKEQDNGKKDGDHVESVLGQMIDRMKGH